MNEFIKVNGRLSLEDGIQSALLFAEIIEHIHSRNWLHRDIKPDNIIYLKNDIRRPVLVDFGISYSSSDSNELATDLSQELGNRFLRLPELSAGSLMKQDPRSDVTFVVGYLFFVLTGEYPHTLEDGEGRLPHQREVNLHLFKDWPRSTFLRLSHIFDKGFSPRLVDRISSIAELRKLLDEVLSKMKSTSDSEEYDWEDLKKAVHSDANKRLADQKIQYDLAQKTVQSAHAEVLKQVSPTFKTFHTGYTNFDTGLKFKLGFSHFANQDKRYAPLFLVKLIGDEYVVSADGETIYRTAATTPTWTSDLQISALRLFKEGLGDVIHGRTMPLTWGDFFITKPEVSIAKAKEKSSHSDKGIFLIIYDENKPNKSKLSYSLGYFMEYGETKRLVNENFVVAVVPQSDSLISDYLPKGETLENAYVVATDSNGSIIRREGVYANPDEGLKRVRDVCRSLAKTTAAT